MSSKKRKSNLITFIANVMGNARVHSSLAKFAFDCNHKILLHSSQRKKKKGSYFLLPPCSSTSLSIQGVEDERYDPLIHYWIKKWFLF